MNTYTIQHETIYGVKAYVVQSKLDNLGFGGVDKSSYFRLALHRKRVLDDLLQSVGISFEPSKDESLYIEMSFIHTFKS